MLKFNVGHDEVNGNPVERLEFEARHGSHNLIQVVLWEDKTAWVYFARWRPKEPRRVVVNLQVSVAGLKAEAIAQLV